MVEVVEESSFSALDDDNLDALLAELGDPDKAGFLPNKGLEVNIGPGAESASGSMGSDLDHLLSELGGTADARMDAALELATTLVR